MTKLEAARAAIAALTDTDKVAIIGLLLEGGDNSIYFDSQEVCDLLGDTSDAFRRDYVHIVEALENAEPADTYRSDVAFDYHTAQAGNGYYA